MIYLDNSATSVYKPNSAINAMIGATKCSANPGRGGHRESIRLGRTVTAARDTIKSCLNADDNYEVIFTSNCTEALNYAILGTSPLRHVITTVFEHNSVLRPLHHLSKIGTKIDYLHYNQLCNITDYINDNTDLIIINHVSNVTGEVADINTVCDICNTYKIPILIDTAQSLGHEKINIAKLQPTMLAAAGHKGIHGCQGAGFLLLKRDHQINSIKFGGTGTESNMLEQPTTLPEALESGTLNVPALLAMTEGLKWTTANYDMLYHHYRYLSTQAHYNLRNINGVQLYSSYPSSIICFNVDDIPSSDVADYLDSLGICVRSGLHCAPKAHEAIGTSEQGAIRASIGYNNTQSDINALVLAIQNMQR